MFVTPCVGVWIETKLAINVCISILPSHPAWVCGLKHVLQRIMRRECLSHPAWVCGLKLYASAMDKKLQGVTPCVGVWIETYQIEKLIKNEEVTPCVGVWIETLILKDLVKKCGSHPAWVCGLKQLRCTNV